MYTKNFRGFGWMLGGLLMPASVALAGGAADVSIRSQLSRLNVVPMGESVEIGLPLGPRKTLQSVRLKHIDVYAPEAKITAITQYGELALPKSNWLHFLADRADANAPRLGISIDPTATKMVGYFIDRDNQAYSLSVREIGREVVFVQERAKTVSEQGGMTCGNGSHAEDFDASLKAVSDDVAASHASLGQTGKAATAITATRNAVLAFDTDNQFMNLKFSNNTTNATNYIAQLVAAMNVIYDRDLSLAFTIGVTTLRPSTTTDPYFQGDAGSAAATEAQLDEFGNFWATNFSGTSRAFAVMLSGKQTTDNSASGIANVPFNTNPLNLNYCNNRAGGSGSYSFNQVFKAGFIPVTADASLVAHEIGHNFGAFHTHCASNATGIGPASSGTIDQCFSGESVLGCYGGAVSCPAPSTVNGVANVRGTVMSYCHFSGCGFQGANADVFADAHRAYLGVNVTNNVTAGCFTAVGGGALIFADGFE